LRQGIDQGRLAGRQQGVARNDLNGSRTLGSNDADLARAGYDDLLEQIFFGRCGRCCIDCGPGGRRAENNYRDPSG